jgi:hypothetical protein
MTCHDKAEFWISDNEESFGAGPFDTREAAVAAAPEELDLEPGQTFWSCEASWETETYAPYADRVIEMAQELAADEAPETAEDWLDGVPDEATQDLDRALKATWDAWLSKYSLEPKWFTAKKVQEHKVPEIGGSYAT